MILAFGNLSQMQQDWFVLYNRTCLKKKNMRKETYRIAVIIDNMAWVIFKSQKFKLRQHHLDETPEAWVGKGVD